MIDDTISPLTKVLTQCKYTGEQFVVGRCFGLDVDKLAQSEAQNRDLFGFSVTLSRLQSFKVFTGILTVSGAVGTVHRVDSKKTPSSLCAARSV